MSSESQGLQRKFRHTHRRFALRAQNNGTFLAASDLIPETSWRQLLWYTIVFGASGVELTAHANYRHDSTNKICQLFFFRSRHLLLITVSVFCCCQFTLKRQDLSNTTANLVPSCFYCVCFTGFSWRYINMALGGPGLQPFNHWPFMACCSHSDAQADFDL